MVENYSAPQQAEDYRMLKCYLETIKLNPLLDMGNPERKHSQQIGVHVRMLLLRHSYIAQKVAHMAFMAMPSPVVL